MRILDFKATRSEFQKASQTATEQGKAKLCILNFKKIWSEFQKPFQTAAMHDKVKLRILDFQTTWSEFQKPCQTAAVRGEAELRIYNLKKTFPPQSRSQAVVCVSTPRNVPTLRVLPSKYYVDEFRVLPDSWSLSIVKALMMNESRYFLKFAIYFLNRPIC